ncbi:MAG: efflux RND transporter permease subunit, partial [Pseudomonadales bacterium]|nr:efflux RND transporter permease subunit [Pseudomonadales bacterium]
MRDINEKGIIAWMAKNPVAANLLLLIVAAAGISALPSLKKEVFPTFPADSLTITVPYPGSSPEEVEQGILLKIEEEIQDIEGIEKITAIAQEGSGRVVIDVGPDEDFNNIFNRIKVRVDSITAFPQESERPLIEENTPRTRVINLSVFGPLDEQGIKRLAEEIHDDLLKLPGITQVEIQGDKNYEISIEISDQTLRAYGLSFDAIVNRIREQSRDLPGGKIRTENGTIVLRSQGQARIKEDFAKLGIITQRDGVTVPLSDIASIRDGFADQPILSLFNGQPGLTIAVSR